MLSLRKCTYGLCQVLWCFLVLLLRIRQSVQLVFLMPSVIRRLLQFLLAGEGSCSNSNVTSKVFNSARWISKLGRGISKCPHWIRALDPRLHPVLPRELTEVPRPAVHYARVRGLERMLPKSEDCGSKWHSFIHFYYQINWPERFIMGSLGSLGPQLLRHGGCPLLRLNWAHFEAQFANPRLLYRANSEVSGDDGDTRQFQHRSRNILPLLESTTRCAVGLPWVSSSVNVSPLTDLSMKFILFFPQIIKNISYSARWVSLSPRFHFLPKNILYIYFWEGIN